MVARGLSLLGVALSLLLPACVVEQSQFTALRDQVRLQQKQISELKARQDEQGLRVDTLNNGFKILGDKAEENALRIDGLAERGEVPVQQVVAEPPAPQPAPVSPAPAPSPAVPEGPLLLTNLPPNLPMNEAAEPRPKEEFITAAPKPEKLYAGALSLYSGRDYPQATAKFEEFVASYPDHLLAGNAQYWIGECYYSQRRFVEAAEAFARVEAVYPASRKVPASLLKKGLSFAELKRMPEAQAALQRILEKYAQSEEATKARERLARWKQP